MCAVQQRLRPKQARDLEGAVKGVIAAFREQLLDEAAAEAAEVAAQHEHVVEW